MSAIPELVRVEVEHSAGYPELKAAVLAILDKGDAWRATGMPMSALADELLLTVAPALGLRIQMGKFAQLVDLDEVGT